jgi:hypothetical protein
VKKERWHQFSVLERKYRKAVGEKKMDVPKKA